MKKYEAPSYEVEYFTLRNDVLTDTSENAGNDLTWLMKKAIWARVYFD